MSIFFSSRSDPDPDPDSNTYNFAYNEKGQKFYLYKYPVGYYPTVERDIFPFYSPEFIRRFYAWMGYYPVHILVNKNGRAETENLAWAINHVIYHSITNARHFELGLIRSAVKDLEMRIGPGPQNENEKETRTPEEISKLVDAKLHMLSMESIYYGGMTSEQVNNSSIEDIASMVACFHYRENYLGNVIKYQNDLNENNDKGNESKNKECLSSLNLIRIGQLLIKR